MKKFKPLRFYFQLSLIIVAMMLTSCKRKHQQPEIDTAFAGYISAFTSGIISNQSSIIIQFQDNQPDAVAGKEIDKTVFNFSPDIKGKTHWKDSRTIEFTPEEPLPSNKLFEARFYLSKIVSVPKKLKTFEFQFQTIEQTIRVSYYGMNAYNHHDLSWQKLNGILLTNDFANDDDIEKLFTAIQNGKEKRALKKAKHEKMMHEA